MNAAKRKKLEAAGWNVGTAAEFLELSKAEEVLVAMKLALAAKVKEERSRRRVSQAQLAYLIGSSQSRVAKVEAADASVSIDLMVRSLASLGVSRQQIGRMVAARLPAAKKAKRK